MSDKLRYPSRITLETVTFVPRRILWLLLLIFILISTDELRLSLAMCNNTAIHTFKRLLNRHLISIKCLQGTNETEYIMSLAARANEIQHRA